MFLREAIVINLKLKLGKISQQGGGESRQIKNFKRKWEWAVKRKNHEIPNPIFEFLQMGKGIKSRIGNGIIMVLNHQKLPNRQGVQ